jgi:hypothetical protein
MEAVDVGKPIFYWSPLFRAEPSGIGSDVFGASTRKGWPAGASRLAALERERAMRRISHTLAKKA